MKSCVKSILKEKTSLLSHARTFVFVFVILNTSETRRKKKQKSVISTWTRDGTKKAAFGVSLISVEGARMNYIKRGISDIPQQLLGKINVQKWQKAFIWHRTDIFSIRFPFRVFFSAVFFYYFTLMMPCLLSTTFISSFYSFSNINLHRRLLMRHRDTHHVEQNSPILIAAYNKLLILTEAYQKFIEQKENRRKESWKFE